MSLSSFYKLDAWTAQTGRNEMRPLFGFDITLPPPQRALSARGLREQPRESLPLQARIGTVRVHQQKSEDLVRGCQWFRRPLRGCGAVAIHAIRPLVLKVSFHRSVE
jgi:hypothetical protein